MDKKKRHLCTNALNLWLPLVKYLLSLLVYIGPENPQWGVANYLYNTHAHTRSLGSQYNKGTYEFPSWQGFMDFFDAPRSELSLIIDLDTDHSRGMHSKIVVLPKSRCKVYFYYFKIIP